MHQAAAARKRRLGEICRKNGDCSSDAILSPDNHGRRRCGCATVADCPSPKSDACEIAVCSPDGVCGIEAVDDGQNCGAGQTCESGVCANNCAGGSCVNGDDCTSQSCNDGVCAAVTVGSSCVCGGDCTSQFYDEGTCAAVSAGSACVYGGDCTSQYCNGGCCAPNCAGGTRVYGNDCTTGYCDVYTRGAVSSGGSCVCGGDCLSQYCQDDNTCG